MSTRHLKLGRPLVATSLALVFSFTVGSAHATLGGDVASIQSNQDHLRASRQVAKLPSGERHDLLVLESGIVIHEYVSATGAVYAVSWSGPRMPDLRELLGPSFGQLDQGGVHRNGLHRMSLSGTDLEIRSMGHRGRFSGRAWVPSLVPPGVHPEASLEEKVSR